MTIIFSEVGLVCLLFHSLMVLGAMPVDSENSFCVIWIMRNRSNILSLMVTIYIPFTKFFHLYEYYFKQKSLSTVYSPPPTSLFSYLFIFCSWGLTPRWSLYGFSTSCNLLIISSNVTSTNESFTSLNTL